jgi:hypothetical protein
MVLGELLEATVSIVKTVWCKRGDRVTRKEVSRVVAAGQPGNNKIKATTTDGSSDVK